MADAPNKVIGGFRVLDELRPASGGQGTVYRAVCEDDRDGLVEVGTEVALKVMPAQDENRNQWRRLERRTHKLVALSHPNVVKYYGCFSERSFIDVHVVVQEFLKGETLKDRLARTPLGLDVDEALRIAKDAVEGLIYTTSMGIVHRDIKPGNIFLCDDGRVKLIDFEIARHVGGSATTGNIRGSFDYMAPEFITPGFRGDIRSDVFSMGVVLHEMLTGRPPYSRLGGMDDEQAIFAFIARWTPWRDKGQSPIEVSNRIRKLLAHTEDLFELALSPGREARYADFALFRDGLAAIRPRVIPNKEDRYTLLQRVGWGGFGIVYKARHTRQGQDVGLVAIKQFFKWKYAERFYREAKIMQKLDSSCLVRFVDFIEGLIRGEKVAFLVMDFLDGMPGRSLYDAIVGARREERRLGKREVLVAFERYARGLCDIHSVKIYHRDIKPSNLYFPPEHPENAVIMDLGIARDERGTKTFGPIPGTPDYMPPEVILAQSRGDSGMDIYALGLCLYEALACKTAYPRLPEGMGGYEEFLKRARSGELPSFDDPDVAGDKQLVSLLRDMTHPDSRRRLKDARIVRARISQLLSDRYPNPVVSPDVRDIRQSSTIGDAVTRPVPPGQTTGEVNAGMVQSGRTVGDIPTRPAPPGLTPDDVKAGTIPRGQTIGNLATIPQPPSAPPSVASAMPPESSPDAVPEPETVVPGDAETRKEETGQEEPQKQSSRFSVIAAVFVMLVSIAGGVYYAWPTIYSRFVHGRFADKPSKPVSEPPKAAPLPIPAPPPAEVEMTIPDLATGVTCWFEGNRTNGVLKLRPGSYSCTYRKVWHIDQIVNFEVEPDKKGVIDGPAEWKAKPVSVKLPQLDNDVKCTVDGGAYADGITVDIGKRVYKYQRPDYKDQGDDFVVEPAESVTLPSPAPWTPTAGLANLDAAEKSAKADDLEKAKRLLELADVTSPGNIRRRNELKSNVERRLSEKVEAERESRRAQVAAEVEKDMKTEPLASRMDRLAAAERRLDKAVADKLFTEDEVKPNRDSIAEKKKWIVGRVVNNADVDVATGSYVIKPGGSLLLSYRDGNPTNFECAAVGRKPILRKIAREGETLTLSPGDFELEIYEVTVPELDDGVVCLVDGRSVSNKVFLAYGRHSCKYTKKGFKDQKAFAFDVSEKSAAVKPPGAWEEIPVPQEVKDAREYLEYKDYYECMKEYYNASKLGYVFTDKDLSDFEMAYNNGSSDLRERIKNYKKQIDDIGRLGFIGDLEAAEKKLAELNEWHAAVRRAQGRENSTL